ncbi:MAG: hypothetical protein ACKV2T_09055 [Kofleriaceae bacterium]
MDQLRQQPVFPFDAKARTQLRESRQTLLDHLRTDPDDFQALVLADVIGEIDPDHDAALAAHRMRFRATRSPDWMAQARERGLDRLLFHLADGMRSARFGRDAVPVLERRAIEISEARAPGVAAGTIDASFVPASLRSVATYHPSGHLARIRVYRDDLHHGELSLAATPGAGTYSISEKRGGYGTTIRDSYRNGCIVTTLNTPWHDGEESSVAAPWTKWVMQQIDDLARLATVPSRKPRKPRKPQESKPTRSR